jgi:hypothetical protein
LTDRLHQLLEDDAVLCNVELLARQPVQGGSCSRSAYPPDNGAPAAAETPRSVGAWLANRASQSRAPAEIAHCLVLTIRNPTLRPDRRCATTSPDRASRRFVFTRSPGFFGMSEGAATMHSCPRLLMCRYSP